MSQPQESSISLVHSNDAPANQDAEATNSPESEVELLRKEIAKLLAAQDETRLAKDAFLSNTTHELKTPLNAIVGYCDLMLAEVEGPIGNDQYKEYLKSIKEGGEKLTAVVNDLLNVARHEAGKVALNEEYESVHEITTAAVRLVQKQVTDSGQSIRTEIQPGLPKVYVDQRALTQALVNLIDNAIKFSEAGDVITVSGAQNGEGHVILSVKDVGCGIEKQKLNEITAPFYFAEDVLTRKTAGLGTGLTVVSRIADLHGATLNFESRVDVGTIVSIVMPTFRNEVINHSEDETIFFDDTDPSVSLKNLLKISYQGFERVFYAGCGKILIGRNRTKPPLIGCDIIVDDKRVSRPHASVSYENGSFTYRDESRSGSHIMKEDDELVSLQHGASVKLEGSGRIYLGDHPLKGDTPFIEFCVETE